MFIIASAFLEDSLLKNQLFMSTPKYQKNVHFPVYNLSGLIISLTSVDGKPKL